MTRLASPYRDALDDVNPSSVDPLQPSPHRSAGSGNHRKPPARVRGAVNLRSGQYRPEGPKVVPVNVEAEIIAIIESKRGAWTAADLAELLGCSGKHIYALAKSGRLPHLRIDGMIRFDPSVTGAWLRERFIAA